jgi:hypothetical protein
MCRCVRGILRSSAWAAVLSFALFGATPSNAGTLTLDFSLEGSTLMLGTLINASDNTGAGMPAGNAGTQVVGMARVVLTGVDMNGVIIDPSTAGGTVSGLNVSFNLNQPVMAMGLVLPANLVGPISITQMGMSAGMFNGSMVTLPTNAFVTQLATNIDCAGTLCASLPALAASLMPPVIIMFPIQQMATIANNTGPFAFTLGNLAGSSTLLAAVMTMNTGQNVNLTFRGTQVARAFEAPEPVEAGLLMLSVLSLCGVAAVRRQRLAA